MTKKVSDKSLIFLLLIVIIHISYFIIAIIYKNIYMADSYEYLQQAFNLKNYANLYCLDFNQPLDMHFFTKRPPLYGLFIMTLKIIINSNYFVLFVQNVLSLLNIIGIVKLLEDYNLTINYKKALLILLIFLPVQFIYSNMIMSEILLQTLLFWSFYYFYLYIKEEKLSYIFISNIFLSLAVLTKPVLLLFWIPNLILLLFLFWKKRKVAIIISGLIMPAVIFLFSLYNFYTTGCFHYSSTKQMSIVGYNSAFLFVNVYGEEEGQKKSAEIRRHLDSIGNFNELITEEDKIGYETIMNHKYEYAKFQIKGMINFFLDPGRFDINNFLGIKEENNSGLLYALTKNGYSGVFNFILKQPIYIIAYIIIMMIANILMVVSMINFIFVKSIKIELKMFIFLIVFYLCLFSGPLGTMRYKVHIIPLLLFTIPFLLEKIKTKFIKLK
jgi:4-amino-4-deoxy-L-arabinose transferase-like glycosyltransferase